MPPARNARQRARHESATTCLRRQRRPVIHSGGRPPQPTSTAERRHRCQTPPRPPRARHPGAITTWCTTPPGAPSTPSPSTCCPAHGADRTPRQGKHTPAPAAAHDDEAHRLLSRLRHETAQHRPPTTHDRADDTTEQRTRRHDTERNQRHHRHRRDHDHRHDRNNDTEHDHDHRHDANGNDTRPEHDTGGEALRPPRQQQIPPPTQSHQRDNENQPTTRTGGGIPPRHRLRGHHEGGRARIIVT